MSKPRDDVTGAIAGIVNSPVNAIILLLAVTGCLVLAAWLVFGVLGIRIVDGGVSARSGDVEIPIGSIIAWHRDLAGKDAPLTRPEGWASCDGQTLWRKDYPRLFERIGGALDSIELPNLNGECRFLRGGDTSGEMDDAPPSTGFCNGGTDLDAHKHETPINNWSSVGAFAVGEQWGVGAQSGDAHTLIFKEQNGVKREAQWKLTNSPHGAKLNEHTHSVSIVPDYYSVIYIMRVQ